MKGEQPHGNSRLVAMPRGRKRAGQLSGAWVFKDTRMPVSAVFENLEAGATIDDIVEQFEITREQIKTVLEFAARSLDAPTPSRTEFPVNVHSL